MPHSFNKIWIHAIWATRMRRPLITEAVEKDIYAFISRELNAWGCPVNIVNGMPDHIHCLFLLSPQKSIVDVIEHIKDSSSFFINYNNLIAKNFAWHPGYAAFSVSESVVDRVFDYIKSQKLQHQKRTFLQEYAEFQKLYSSIRIISPRTT